MMMSGAYVVAVSSTDLGERYEMVVSHRKASASIERGALRAILDNGRGEEYNS